MTSSHILKTLKLKVFPGNRALDAKLHGEGCPGSVLRRLGAINLTLGAWLFLSFWEMLGPLSPVHRSGHGKPPGRLGTTSTPACPFL